MFKTKIKYLLHDKNCQIKQFGNWIDLSTSESITMNPDSFKIIPLGISMELPKWHEANIVPRSSTFKNFAIIQSNSQGVIDEDYCGMNDIWGFPAISLNKHVIIDKYSRICQFRVNLSQNAPWYVKLKWVFSKYVFEEVSVLHRKSRGGFGSTGKN